ncbi:MAG: extracellular solute-binding protein [Sphingomicrobium sp.]
MTRRLLFIVIAALVVAIPMIALLERPSVPVAHRPYSVPPNAVVTHFPSTGAERQRLVIEAATDVSFMRPLIAEFQRQNPDVAIIYEDGLSTDVLARALDACRNQSNIPDLYLSVATDHLVRLANDGCGQPAADDLVVPPWREWRHEVIAFALEPAVFAYNRKLLSDHDAPNSHVALINALRSNPHYWNARVGTYDIRKSGIGYNYAEFDSRESSLYGRLIESLGRSHAELFCCSNEMVRAVEAGSVVLAYNVQLSYALAAQRANPDVGIVVPGDFQAVQTRSVLIPAGATNVDLAQRFVAFLQSPAASSITSALLASPMRGHMASFVPSDRLLNQADVSSALLRLQDPARRAAFTHEWLQAIHADAMIRTPTKP